MHLCQERNRPGLPVFLGFLEGGGESGGGVSGGDAVKMRADWGWRADRQKGRGKHEKEDGGTAGRGEVGGQVAGRSAETGGAAGA